MSAFDSAIAAAIEDVRRRIGVAGRRVGRDPDAVLLLGATKSVPAADVVAAARAGLEAVGENRVQELLDKQRAVGAEAAGAKLRWDFIGTLQRNKVSKVVGRVTLIHGVDSLPLASAIAARASAIGITQDLLLEVNTSGEASKHGILPADAVDAARAVSRLDGVRLRGLMTIAAASDSEASRLSFRTLAAIARGAGWPADAPELSMGMTDDFEIAVEEGATIVRVGTAIFGARCEAGLGA